MKKEKLIENKIKEYLQIKGAIVEGMQGGAIMVKYGKFTNKLTLQSSGCPDLIVLYRSRYIGIEVKKNQEEVDKWLKLKTRYYSGETLPKSYKRELNQILYSKNIIKEGGLFLITCDILEVMDFIKDIR